MTCVMSSWPTRFTSSCCSKTSIGMYSSGAGRAHARVVDQAGSGPAATTTAPAARTESWSSRSTSRERPSYRVLR